VALLDWLNHVHGSLKAFEAAGGVTGMAGSRNVSL
jgi:hypothetical protein